MAGAIKRHARTGQSDLFDLILGWTPSHGGTPTPVVNDTPSTAEPLSGRLAPLPPRLGTPSTQTGTPSTVAPELEEHLMKLEGTKEDIGANAPHSSQADRQGDQLKPGFAEPITLKPNETNDRHRFDGDQPITPRPETGIPASPMPAGFGRQEAECPGGHHAEQTNGSDGTTMGVGPEVLTGRAGDLLAPAPAGGPSGGNGKARRACDDARDAWNAAASRCGWPTVQRFHEARKKALTARLADIGGLDGWATMLAKLEASPWIRHQPCCTFDWVLKPANLTKIMEGNYDNKSPGAPAANGHGTSAGFAAAASLLRDKVYSGL